MTFRHLYWLWANSVVVGGGDGGLARYLTRRIRFYITALRFFEDVRPFIDAAPDSGLGKLVAERPDVIGAVIWPYQCLGWDASTRLSRICRHYRIVDGGPLDIRADKRLLLLDLAEIRDGLCLVLDRPKWFIREGEMAINLFLFDTRIYSLVFSLFEEGGVVTAYIGAIQGRDLEGIMDQYRSLTKAANGMRPRDLLIELFKMFCIVADIKSIRAISDDCRQHRSTYYGSEAETKVQVNYDAVWADRGGKKFDQSWYDLPSSRQERNLDGIPAKKRSMYRKRYQMLEVFYADLCGNWSKLTSS